MKRIVFMMMAAMVALGATANDRLYIEDFSIAPGESRTVSIMLDNEASYTAFQADIYLPEGLTIEQEDGEYIFDLTSRKARDHNIASQLQADGAIRVMSYSPGIKAYSGNSGALVTFQVTTDSDFTGPASIQMKTILLITTAGVELPFADEECVVTVATPVIRGDMNGDGEVDVNDVTTLISAVLGSTPLDLEIADLNSDGMIDVVDVTVLIALILNQ